MSNQLVFVLENEDGLNWLSLQYFLVYMCQAVYGIRNTVFCTIVLAKNTAD